MSIVLEALEKAQKEKSRIEAQSLLQKRLEEEKPPVKTEEEHKSSKPNIEKVLEKRQEAKVRLVPRIMPRFNKKFIIFILVVANIFFVSWWLNYNDSIVYEDPSLKSPISTSQNIQIPALQRLFLEDTPQADVIEKLPPLNVTGVVWDQKDPIVLVNSRFLKKGDEIIGAKVVDIQLHEVKFLYKDKEFTISVE